MIKRIEDLNYYELLEVNPSATTQEIHKAYERIRRVYEPNSMALYSLFTADETTSMYQRIEDAYRTLIYEENRKKYDLLLKNKSTDTPAPPEAPPAPAYQPQPLQPALTLPSKNRHIIGEQLPLQPPIAVTPPEEMVSPVAHLIAEFTGPAIKAVREQSGLTLRNIADTTKLGVRYLEFIEEENFTKLPARTYVRGFLMLYAKALGCDPERMTSDYLKRYSEHLKRYDEAKSPGK
jgi:curved DNA-binding protein CbpA